MVEAGQRLPSYQRIADYAVTRDPLPRTRLGKLRRHLLPQNYAQAKTGRAQAAGPLPLEQMAEADRLLLEDTGLRQVWDWLAVRFKDRHLTPDTGLRLDLGVDSIGWLDLALEVQRLCGVELDEKTIAGIETVRDLLKATQTAPAAAAASWDAPERVLAVQERARLRPHSGLPRVAHGMLLGFNRLLMRRLFRLRVNGLAHLPAGQIVLAPNHASYLDPFVIAAALPPWRLARTCWGGWSGVAFTNPLSKGLSRLARVLPVDPEGGALRSLAFAAAALGQGDNLVWFPEGMRSVSGELQVFRPGIGMLLARFPVVVVPVRIEGSFAALPPGRRWPRRVPISVTFGEPFDPRSLGEVPRAALAEQITQALQQRLAAMIQAAQSSA